MKLLIFGKNGQVAKELKKIFPNGCYIGRDAAELSRVSLYLPEIEKIKPDIIINVAAYTNVNGAETEEALATKINGEAPTAIAAVAACQGIPLIHVSTDYVFPGTGNFPWSPEDHPGPISAYGRSKLVGEQGVQSAGGRHIILRTSWIVSSHGNNFLTTMLRLGRKQTRVDVVSDQIGGLTPAADVAATLMQIASELFDGRDVSGIFHLSGAPDASWATIAREIFNYARIDCQVRDISAVDYVASAQRPYNSRLDCTSLHQNFGVSRPDWILGIRKILDELGYRDA